MKNKSTVLMSGSSGFVGQNIIDLLSHNYIFIPLKLRYRPNQIITLDSGNVILHLAGISHDLNKKSNSLNYLESNFDLTKQMFNSFLKSNATTFIYLSSVKAVADEIDSILLEDATPNPITHYGKSKLLAEKYILSKLIPEGKRVYILRPCMIYGPGNKGNLNLLYSLVSKGLPWPLGLFENSRSYLSVENLCFVIKELINREDIPSGVYNVADDVPLSTNEVIKMIAESTGKKARILKLSKNLIKVLASIGDLLKLPLNTERLKKLTESYVVSNAKIKKALDKQLLVSSKEGLMRTFQSFTDNA